MNRIPSRDNWFDQPINEKTIIQNLHKQIDMAVSPVDSIRESKQKQICSQEREGRNKPSGLVNISNFEAYLSILNLSLYFPLLLQCVHIYFQFSASSNLLLCIYFRKTCVRRLLINFFSVSLINPMKQMRHQRAFLKKINLKVVF